MVTTGWSFFTPTSYPCGACPDIGWGSNANISFSILKSSPEVDVHSTVCTKLTATLFEQKKEHDTVSYFHLMARLQDGDLPHSLNVRDERGRRRLAMGDKKQWKGAANRIAQPISCSWHCQLGKTLVDTRIGNESVCCRPKRNPVSLFLLRVSDTVNEVCCQQASGCHSLPLKKSKSVSDQCAGFCD